MSEETAAWIWLRGELAGPELGRSPACGAGDETAIERRARNEAGAELLHSISCSR